jgi:dTDP-4-amino-4,6-dideoxygalactose transaminase
VVVTHLYGLMADLDPLLELTERAGVPLIEDCAQAHGARRGAARAGSRGAAAAFSFYPTKNLGAVGDGGAVVTSDPAIEARVRSLRQYGWRSKYHAVDPGGRNSRLDELQAAVLRAKLPSLDRWNARRRQIAALYADRIRNPRVRCPSPEGESHVAHLYVVVTDDRDDLRRHLAASGIACEVHYPVPDHLQTMLAGRPRPSLPVTESLCRKVLTLPCYPELSDEEVLRICERVDAW